MTDRGLGNAGPYFDQETPVKKIPTDPIELRSLELVWAERLRQKEVEGYTPAHDDEHTEGQLAVLAAAYVLSSRGPNYTWLVGQVALVLSVSSEAFHFKPADPIRDLVRAGALILAELERRLRADA